VYESGSLRRIADLPFEPCVTLLDSWLPGPLVHDREWGTVRAFVCLARRWRRRRLRMRLDVDRWSPCGTAFELTPCEAVRPTASYFRAGHQFLDALIHSLGCDLRPDEAWRPDLPPSPLSWRSDSSLARLRFPDDPVLR
jgi:hypothetical protein